MRGDHASGITLSQRNDARHARERQLSGDDLIRLIARERVEFHPEITAGSARTAPARLQVAHDLHSFGRSELDLAASGRDQLLAAGL